jgi:hypothetical protein
MPEAFPPAGGRALEAAASMAVADGTKWSRALGYTTCEELKNGEEHYAAENFKSCPR